MKKRTGDPWMSADDFGRSLTGVGFNLLVANVERAIEFQRNVLGVTVIYQDTDFAVVENDAGLYMLHADHTYRDHPMVGIATNAEGRGAGIELRLYNLDPDTVEARANDAGYTILAGSADKPHGLRESYIIDDDGYVWVPCVPLL
ncbi:MAG: hypothetical protein DHS20C01_02860 [marine bacterium B5-7]|nr:MAG: hypothetical protein DHS20C01_02860 [marine bacterium B5-7]